ncbi:MAG: hypothetical protein E7164_03205 [Firmicutes bacterium]|nr:hypothetical protein [Bacillota bacterium]
MKLNNKGWGFPEMIVFSSVLLLLLFFASYYIYVLYNNLDGQDGITYASLETRLQTKAMRYVSEYDLKENKVIVSVSDLKRLGYLESFADDKGNECKGYVVYEESEYTSYISCMNFTSSGYNEIYE